MNTLIVAGWVFLGGLNLDGTAVGAAYRDARYEVQVSYVAAATKEYGFKNLFSLTTIPTMQVVRPLVSKAAELRYHYLATRSMRVTTMSWVWPVELGIGMQQKLWFGTTARWSGGPTAFIALLGSDNPYSSAVRLGIDCNAVTPGWKTQALDVTLTLVIKLSSPDPAPGDE